VDGHAWPRLGWRNRLVDALTLSWRQICAEQRQLVDALAICLEAAESARRLVTERAKLRRTFDGLLD
jgi:hypothetical protein